MERLAGIYSVKSKAIIQKDYQIMTLKFDSFDGWNFPVAGPFSFVNCTRGTARLYCSAPGETPLYYNYTSQNIAWSEQCFDLGSGGKRVRAGEMVTWEPGTITTCIVNELPRPPIVSASQKPFDEYGELLIAACERRLATLPNPKKVALAQSGGLDSLLLAWALKELGVEILPITVCSNELDLDIVGARSVLSQWGIEVIPAMLTFELIKELLPKAVAILEDVESSNVRMGIGNILIAQKLQEIGVEAIFIGHGHDDIHGKGTLVKPVFEKQTASTVAQRWRDARRATTAATGGMLKMFASNFRSHGIHVRMPYYDKHLLDWAFSQPTEIIPVAYDKPFVRAFANHVLPPGEWSNKQHSIGYLTGAGLSLKQPLLQKDKEAFTPKELNKLLKKKENGKRKTEKVRQSVGDLNRPNFLSGT